MIAIGVYDAKTQLPKLLERVRRGERFLITKHGRPVAKLVPAGAEGALDVKQIVEEMQAWQEREGPTLGPGLTIRQLREEGRRDEQPGPSNVGPNRQTQKPLDGNRDRD